LKRRRVALLIVLAVLGGALYAAPRYLRAAGLLLRFADPDSHSRIARFGTHELEVRELSLDGPRGPIPARLYVPKDMSDAPGVVMLHGVHRLSIDEPRLVRFARAIAATGAVVLTPAIAEIAGYRVDPASIDTIGVAANKLAEMQHHPVGIIGMSFGGGLALLAAADPRYAASIGLVLSIGGHDDMKRVARFFATGIADEPSGPPLHMKAHPYGALVLAHANADGFFPPADIDDARAALSAWLGERWDEAKAHAAKLSPPSRTLVEHLFAGTIDQDRQQFLDAIDRVSDKMIRISPHDHVAALTARVFILHGAADTVIPPSEADWLLHDLPPAAHTTLLVTPALGHVELAGVPTLREQLALVGFMAQALAALGVH
jgi:dienelactone hydrolase